MVDSRPLLTGESRPNRRRLFIAAVSGSLIIAVGLLAAIIVNNINTIIENSDNHNNNNNNEKRETFRSRGVSMGVSEKANRVLGSPVVEFPWNNSMLSWQRTAFHFQPDKNWMNDPNGPLWYKGWYHFFYQYNPNAAVWGDIVWGHAVSKDLIEWQHLPIAMVPDQWYDANGVWSGSATILSDGSIVMLYTGSTNESVQVQNLAFPADPNDPLLVEWVKYEGNPVLVPPPGIGSKDFRDPTTAWLTSEGKWRITVGSKINRTGISLVYDTVDFKNYELIPGILHGVPTTGMWECVDFYPVSATSDVGLDTSASASPEVRHVLKASLDDDRHDYYAIGTYHDKNATWIPDNPSLDVGIGIRYDYGIFYASKSFYDSRHQRRVLWGWIGESDTELADVTKGWASLQAIPRTVTLDRITKSDLLQWPVSEIETLRLDSKDFDNVELSPGLVVALEVGTATQLDIIAEFELDPMAVEQANQTLTKKDFRCSGASRRGALGPFGILVLADENRSEQTPVYFYVVKDSDGNLKTFFCNDQSRSTLANDVNKQVYGSMVPVVKDEKLSVRILVDHSIVESFAQRGRRCISCRVYPTKAIYGGAKVFVFNNATQANVTASLKIWQMKSAFIRPYQSH